MRLLVLRYVGCHLAFLLSSALAQDSAKPIVEGPEGRRAYDDLATYYKTGTQPPFGQALTALSSDSETERKEAGGYLLALFAQSFADETNRRAEWHRLPFWGGGAESPAREFRKRLAEKFGATAQGAEALQAAQWLLENEQLAENQVSGMWVLRRTETPESTEILGRLLQQPHPNPEVLAGAIKEVAKRGLSQLSDDIYGLRNHYHVAVRAAAREAIPTLNHQKRVTAFEPEQAFTPWLDSQLRNIAAMVLTEIPSDAKWTHFRYTEPTRGPDDEPTTRHFGAWLLREDENRYFILNHFASEGELLKKHTTASEGSLAGEGKALLSIREEDSRDALDSLSTYGGLTGQFEPSFISVPELLVSAWSYVRGDKKTVAAILFPRMEQMADDRWLTWTARDLLAHPYHQKMLEAFSHDRDYQRAMTLARHLSKPLFDDYEYQDRAKELASQLEKRQEDFGTFVLPTPREWQRMQKKVSRREQISYLAGRLRLLNCIQWGQPGGVSYGDPQYSKPNSELGAKSEKELKKKEVINPYSELRQMKISVAELPALVPFIADRNYMPTFSYWRNFHPSRTLHQVNWAVASIVNDIAKRNLANLEGYEALDAEGQKRHIQAILAWCKENAGKTDEQLILATMHTSSEWREFGKAAAEAVHERYKSALSVLVERAVDFPEKKDDVAKLAFGLNAEAAVPAARKWLEDESEAVRFWASLILLRHGDRDKLEGLGDLKAILDEDNGSEWHPRAVETLLATGHEEAMAMATGILYKNGFNLDWSGDPILRRLFLAGRKKCLDYLLSGLSSDGTDEHGRSEADAIAGIVAQWRTDKYEYGADLPAEQKAAKRSELKKWLTEQFGRITKGKTPRMNTTLDEMVFPEWQIDAP